MKIVLTFIFTISLIFGFSQDTKEKVDIVEKVLVINPLPVSIYNTLKEKGTSVEVTMYTSSKTFTLPKNSDVNYFLTLFEGQATTNFNQKNSAYVMIMVNEDFYMDAEISLSKNNNYIIFKKDGVQYYNLLNEKGIIFFSKYL